MINKIEGIPEGWKVKRIGYPEIGEYLLSSKDKVLEFTDIIQAGLLIDFNISVILERDIKIIDMSKCKVDVEYEDVTRDRKLKWFVASCGDKLTGNPKIRVRQNHYFGWQGGECPLPEGLVVEVYCRGYLDEQSAFKFNPISSRDCSCHSKVSRQWEWRKNKLAYDVIGFEVVGVSKGYAYEHEIEGGGRDEQ